MKNLLILLFVLQSALYSLSQNTFRFNYGEPNVEEAPFSIIETDNGNYYSGIYKQGSTDVESRIIGINSKGNIIAEHDFGITRILGLQKDRNEIFCYGYHKESDSIWLKFFKLNEQLDVLTERAYSIIDYQEHRMLESFNPALSVGDSVVCWFNCQHDKSFIFITNTNCDSISSLSTNCYIFDFCIKINNSGYYATGSFDQSLFYPQIATIDKLFNVTQVNFLDMTPNTYLATSLDVEVHDDQLYVAGTEYIYQQDNYQIGISTFDTVSFSEQTHELAGEGETANHLAFRKALRFDSNDFSYVFATINDLGGMPYKPYDNVVMLTKFDIDGTIIYEKYFGGDAFYQAYTFNLTSDGGVILGCTRFDHEVAMYDDVVILKLDADGNLPTSLEEQPNLKTSEQILYPNPGTSELTVRTAVQSLGGEFTLLDISGKTVLQQTINEQITNLNITNLPAGTYLHTYIREGAQTQSGVWVKQ